VRVAVAGASGYTGGELLRLIDGHPDFELGSAMAGSNAGESFLAFHPQLFALSGRTFEPTDARVLAEHDLVFLALPHGQSAAIASSLPQSVRVVDLGADFRLHSAASWSKYYGGAHAGTWTYGLPEWNRAKIAGSYRIANPGCYATAIELALMPIAEHIDASDIVAVAASGTSGAGRSLKPNLLASEVMGNMTAYKVGGLHQHTPEIQESIQAFAGVSAKVLFTPLLAPMPRGILATITARTSADIDELKGKVASAYEDEPYVHLLEDHVQPNTAATLGTNAVLLQLEADPETQRVVVTVALDNLVKGAAGQALQNANLMCGFDETTGLSGSGVRS
jgi:N-acetyl-gamma-glutamyl-phosphate reductase